MDDKLGNSNTETANGEISDRFLFFSVLGVGFGSLVGAFGISLAMARRRSPDFTMRAVEGHESPGRLAARALGWGTLLACSGVTGLVLAVGYLSGSSNAMEFGQKAKNFLSPKFKKS